MAASSPVVSQTIKALAREYYLEKARVNDGEKKRDGLRLELLQAMEAGGVGGFAFETTKEDGSKVRLAVEIETPDKVWIDVPALRDLVDEETFFRIVTASKKAVEEEAGKATVLKVTRVEVAGGTRNVAVKPAK